MTDLYIQRMKDMNNSLEENNSETTVRYDAILQINMY